MKRAKSEADTRSRHVGSAVRALQQQDKLLSDVEDSQVPVKGYVWPYNTAQPRQQQHSRLCDFSPGPFSYFEWFNPIEYIIW